MGRKTLRTRYATPYPDNQMPPASNVKARVEVLKSIERLKRLQHAKKEDRRDTHRKAHRGDVPGAKKTIRDQQ